MPAPNIAEFFHAHAREIASAIAGRIRLDNPAYADRPLEELQGNAERLLVAATEFLVRLDWAPMDAFLRDVAKMRKDEFKLSDVVGALTSAERVLVQYLEEHDPSGSMRSSPQWSRFEAGLHRLRSALVERLWEALSAEAGARLEQAMARLEACREKARSGQVDGLGAELGRVVADVKKARQMLGSLAGEGTASRG